MYRMKYYRDHECEEASKKLDNLQNDPITIQSSCGGEMSQDWLKKHIKTCKKCEEATMLGNTP